MIFFLFSIWKTDKRANFHNVSTFGRTTKAFKDVSLREFVCLAIRSKLSFYESDYTQNLDAPMRGEGKGTFRAF